MDSRKIVVIDYVNWRGERRERRIVPTGHIEFANTEWHPETQWLLEAVDCEDSKTKDFAMSGIMSWRALFDGVIVHDKNIALKKASDEIERLRAELVACQKANNSLRAALSAAIERADAEYGRWRDLWLRTARGKDDDA